MPGTWAGRGLEVWEGEGMGGWVTVAAGSAAEAMAEEGWAVGAREGWGMVAVGCKEGGSGGARLVDDNGMVDRGKSVHRCVQNAAAAACNTWGLGGKGWAEMAVVEMGAMAAAGSAAEAMAEEGWAVGAREDWGMVAVGCKEGGSGGARQVDDNGMVDRGKSVQRCTAYKKLELLELLQLANTWGSGRKGWAVMVAVATGEVGCSNQTQRGWQLHCYRQRTTR